MKMSRKMKRRCYYCGEHIQRGQRTRDHVWPRCVGGYETVDCCQPCNCLKADLTPEEFRQVLFGAHIRRFHGEIITGIPVERMAGRVEFTTYAQAQGWE